MIELAACTSPDHPAMARVPQTNGPAFSQARAFDFSEASAVPNCVQSRGSMRDFLIG
jgi:hypothetical protein